MKKKKREDEAKRLEVLTAQKLETVNQILHKTNVESNNKIQQDTDTTHFDLTEQDEAERLKALTAKKLTEVSLMNNNEHISNTHHSAAPNQDSIHTPGKAKKAPQHHIGHSPHHTYLTPNYASKNPHHTFKSPQQESHHTGQPAFQTHQTYNQDSTHTIENTKHYTNLDPHNTYRSPQQESHHTGQIGHQTYLTPHHTTKPNDFAALKRSMSWTEQPGVYMDMVAKEDALPPANPTPVKIAPLTGILSGDICPNCVVKDLDREKGK